MASLIRKKYTAPMPDGAELFTSKGKRFARWIDAQGKTQTAPVVSGKGDALRIQRTSPAWVAKYRGGDDTVIERSTGCKDKSAAAAVLSKWEGEAERIRAGLVSPSEAKAAQHAAVPLTAHVEAYRQALELRGATSKHVASVARYLNRVINGCGFRRIADLDRQGAMRWLHEQRRQSGNPMGARLHNAHVIALTAFGNWLLETGRHTANPFARMDRASEAVDQRRQRRALTPDEAARLIQAARQRPTYEVLYNHGGRKPKGAAPKERKPHKANPRPHVLAAARLHGERNAAFYTTAIYSGLRMGELHSLRVCDLDLPGKRLHLAAANAKNRQAATVPLRGEVCEALREYLALRLKTAQEGAQAARRPFPMALDPQSRLFDDLPLKMIKPFNLDLKAAGIAKRDQRGRTVDVHSLRMTCISWMNAAGVAPRTAQALARHSDIRLTMQTYTDPQALDMRGAVESLPWIGGEAQGQDVAQAAHGSADAPANSFPHSFPNSSPNGDISSQSESHIATNKTLPSASDTTRGSANKDRGFEKTQEKNGVEKWWAVKDSNLWPSACKADALTN
ncbi:MAG: hypothetical protein AMXMBFR84_16530 [Candidatus Hydrogenedentota bacterium]